MARKPVEEKATRRTAKAAPATKSRRTKAAVEEAPAKTRRAKTPAKEAPAKRTRKKVEEAPVTKTRRAKAAPDEAPARKTRAAKAVEAEAPARKSKKKEAESEAVPAFNPYAHLDDTLDAIEKHVGVSDSAMDKSEKRQSTGNLALDIILGGGLTAGWYTNFGQEQSCKTTTAVMMMAAALNSDVPILSYWDYEGSATPDYIENIMHTLGVKSDVRSIFGVRDEKTGNWIIPPRVRYKSEGVAEKFFDYLAQLQRRLPDKKRIGDNWYYIYDGKTPDGKIHKENAKIVGDSYDKNYFRKTGKYRVPAKDGTLQALILVDSYPAMLPEKQDVDDPNSAIGAQARMFSDQLKRVKGKMRGKRIAIIGINQLRLKPMVMMGNPEYEPCGETLKLMSDCRLKFTSRALSAVSKHLGETVKGEGQIESERSVQFAKGEDNYRYIHVRAHKNKLSRPYLEFFMRLWITDAKGNAQGFDPVFDVYQYLKFTGQLSGKRSKMTLKFEGNEANKAISWRDFKSLILGKSAEVKDLCASIGMKPVKLREKCFQQIASGRGIDLYCEYTLQGKDKEEGDDDDSSDDGDED